MNNRASPSQALPLVTIAMPVFNGGLHLRPAVRSVMSQTYANWELLVIDDGSTDGALNELEDVRDPRIRILRDNRNTGIAVRLNQAVDLARGQYFARMDADDISFPERLAKQVAKLQADGGLDLLATRAITVNESNELNGTFPHAISHEDICARPWRGFHFPHPTWMGKTEWFRAHRYAVPAPYLCEDQELLLRTYLRSRFATLDEVLFAYRVRSTVDWRRLARIRGAMAACQLRNFSRLGQWHFAGMALLAWLAKTIRDGLRRIARSSHVGSRHGIPAALEQRWREVLLAVTDNARAP